MKTIQLSERELSIVYSLMAPPYRAEDIRSDEFNELRNKVFYALRDAQNDEPVTTAYKLPEPIKDNRLNSGPDADDYYAGYQAGWNELLEAVSSNSPVIPDGWVMVPVEPTEAMINAYRGALYSGESAVSCIDLYKAMIAAAPQQEA